MLWWIGVVTGGVAAWRFFSNDEPGWGWLAVVVAVAGLWTAGIAANFRRGEEQQIPDLAARVNIASVVGGIGVLVASFLVT